MQDYTLFSGYVLPQGGEIRLRALQKNEIPVIQDLAYQIWPPTFSSILSLDQIHYMLEWMYSPSRIVEELEKGVEWFIIESVPNNSDVPPKSIGYVSWEISSSRDGIYLHKIYLLPAHQHLGIGRFVFSQLQQLASKLPGKWIQLRVNRRNTQAIRAYQRYGFIIVREDRRDIGNGFVMDDYIMEWHGENPGKYSRN